MTQTTEAACLLQSGSTYHRRVGLASGSAEVIFAGVKPGAVSLYFGDAPIYHFDLDGRWQRAFVEETHYLKGLDATVRSIDRERQSGAMVLRREKLPYALAADLDDSIRSVALGLIDDLDSNRLGILEPPAKSAVFRPEELREFLERVAGWDSAAWFAHRERYLATYGPMPFVPPDAQGALVLQATLGDAGGIAFGGARPAEPYVRSTREFLDHVRQVRRIVGRRIVQHRGVFLAGADSLRRPIADLIADLKSIEASFPAEPASDGPGDRWDDFPGKPGSVVAFLDNFVPPLPDLEGWRTLRSANLGSVTVGIESGDPTIRSGYGRTWDDASLRSTLLDLRSAGIGIGAVALVGAGGRRLSSRHVEATARLLGSLPIERGDLVTLVDARSFEGRSLDDPLSDEETAAQVAEFKSRLAGGSKVVVYNPLKRRS